MISDGYIKIFRKMMDRADYFDGKFDKTHAWIDLLLLAQFEPGIEKYRGREIPLERGELAKSISFFADRWGWARKTVLEFFDSLQKADQIAYDPKTFSIGKITIKNYTFFQGLETGRETSQETGQETGQKTGQKTGQAKEVPPLPPLENNLKTKDKENKKKDKERKSVCIPTASETLEANEEMLSKLDPNDNGYGKFCHWVKDTAYCEVYNHMLLPSKQIFDDQSGQYGIDALYDVVLSMVNNPKAVKDNKRLGLTMKDWLRIRFRR